MSRWLVNARGQQFSAQNMDELRKLAKRGDLAAGDIVQPPGASEWIYALEVPELKGALHTDGAGEFDVPPPREMSPIVKGIAALALAGLAVGAWSYALSLRATIPQAEDLELIGGKKGLSFTEVLVTAENAQLQAEPNANAAAVAPLVKNSKADLLAKRGSWYKLRVDGKEGYASVESVIPAYFFADDKTKLDYDPLYNPDKYVYVRNSSWQLLPEGGNKNVTVFTFLLGNDSKFVMTDLKLVATIKDKNKAVLETKEIPVEGSVPAELGTMVGILKADKHDKTSVDRVMTTSMFEELAKTDPELNDRWVDGVEVKLDAEGFTEAQIELLEMRAVPPDEMPKQAPK
jgi:hypothetical protein